LLEIRKSGKFVDYGGRKLKIEDLYRLYEHGDKIVTGNVEKNAEYLGIGISNTIKMFNPELIIIHGEIIKFGNKYLSKVRESVSKKTFPKVKDNYNIQFSKLGENVGLIGATSVVFNSIFDLDSSSVAGHYIIKKKIS